MTQWSHTGLSFTSDQAYAYMGYSHSSSSHSSSSHSSSSHSGHSYAGPPISPMLSAGISNGRDDLNSGLMTAVLGKAGDVGAAKRFGAASTTQLPPLNVATSIGRWAPLVRSTLVEFELVSRLAFRCPVDQQAGDAVLYHLDIPPYDAAGAPAGLSASPIMRMSRPSRAFFEKQLLKVESRASMRASRGPEILTQMDPPMGYFASIGNLHSERTPKTLHLLALAQHFAYIIDMRFKHALACPRPLEYSAFIQPMIETPAHGALPAGHAVESYMCAGVMQALIPGFGKNTVPGQVLRRLAHRVAENRVVAGLHFPVDCLAGRLLGDVLAQYFVAMSTPGAGWTDAIFDGASLDPASVGGSEPNSEDPEIDGAWAVNSASATAMPGCSAGGPHQPAAPVPELVELWKHAQGEWL